MIKTYIFLSLVISILFLNSHPANSQWVNVSNGSGLQNASPNSITVSGNTILVGCEFSGVFLTTNSGANWTQTLTSPEIFTMMASGNYIYAGGPELFISSNNGSNWTQYSVFNHTIETMITSGNNLFAGTYSYGVFLSTNNGVNWSQTPLNNQTILSLAVSGSYIFAGTNAAGLYVSTNNGSSWTVTSLPNLTIQSLAVSGNYIYAGTNNHGVYISSNYGTTWTPSSLSTQLIGTLAASGTGVIAGVDNAGGVYGSTDYGVTWIARSEGLNNESTDGFAFLNNYVYTVVMGNINGVYRRSLSEVIGIKQISQQVPEHFTLSQNYPNPFNPGTNIVFRIANPGLVTLKIFDMDGREVQTLVNKSLQPGSYEATWDASNMPSGVYFYRLKSGSFDQTNKMVLVK